MVSESQEPATQRLAQIVKQTRNISLDSNLHEKKDTTFRDDDNDPTDQPSKNILGHLETLVKFLNNHGHSREAGAITDVLTICSHPPDLGGLGLAIDTITQLSPDQESEVLFLVSAWLEALNSADRSKSPPTPLTRRPEARRGMTLSEKIFAMHDIDQNGSVAPGDLIRVNVDWVIASEASWAGMEATYTQLGKPGIFRNDRFWLAGDHVVDPRVNKLPKVKALIDASERAKRVFKMTEYQGMNYTILHTEFYRERAQPGMMIVGSDSHTCSSGSLGCLSIGLGAADVTLPLVTGETWFKVPETVNVRLVGKPGPGIGGKDTILYILQQLKRNTVAADRIVEFTGPGLQYLSCDARFAIANMTTEFGGITGIFVPDQITYDFIQKRRAPRYKNATTYFRPDDDAQYVEIHEIDLSRVRSFLARYPNPDDVIPVTEHEGMELDGCFIGACTTAEEDLILAALVLEQGLQRGCKPVKKGKRKVVPGSLPILRRLRELGLIGVYEQAGFEVGIPGCSYCVGMSADQAGAGEVWLSSQNRNFQNRMGKGSIGHLGSAATVAASSFEMKLTDPYFLLDAIDLERWNSLRAISESPATKETGLLYVEPSGSHTVSVGDEWKRIENVPDLSENENAFKQDAVISENILKGKVKKLGDFIDTDALAPADFLVTCRSNEAIGAHCLEYTNPEFRQHVKDGYNIVVAGKAFGCGSSREQAVGALLGCGVQCVIAKSFSFIFARNQPNLGLMGITITDEAFYKAAADGVEIAIDLTRNMVTVNELTFQFRLSQMEKELFTHGGISSAFGKFGAKLFEVMCMPKKGLGGIFGSSAPQLLHDDHSLQEQKLQW